MRPAHHRKLRPLLDGSVTGHETAGRCRGFRVTAWHRNLRSRGRIRRAGVKDAKPSKRRSKRSLVGDDPPDATSTPHYDHASRPCFDLPTTASSQQWQAALDLLSRSGPDAGAPDPAALFEVLFERNGWKGDAAILAAGTGHERLDEGDDFLVVGAYPAFGKYNLCRASKEEHDRAVKTVPKVPIPRKDPVYGLGGPLVHLWHKSV
jgi:hypothetical protein